MKYIVIDYPSNNAGIAIDNGESVEACSYDELQRMCDIMNKSEQSVQSDGCPKCGGKLSFGLSESKT